MQNFKTALDKAELFLEIAIFICLMYAAIASFEADILESVFYTFMAALISPFTKINRPAKRLMLAFGFVWGVWIGYFG